MSTSAVTAWRVEFINNSNAFAIYNISLLKTHLCDATVELRVEISISLSHESSREAPQIGQQNDGNGFYH
jgi:hypothetical protein